MTRIHGPLSRRKQVLNTPEITFDIHELVANQTGKLLAVVGLHSIRVIELPRKGWIDSTAASIDVRYVLRLLDSASDLFFVLWTVAPKGAYFRR